jgi:hypothetical protein
MTPLQRITEDLRAGTARVEAVSDAPRASAAPTLRAVAALLRGIASELVDIAGSGEYHAIERRPL